MHLFALPIEIRLQIYSELLICPEPVRVSAVYGDWHKVTIRTTPKYSTYVEEPKGQRWPISFEPSLLRVNKQVHSEASQVLYSENRFEFNLWMKGPFQMPRSPDSHDDGDLFASFLPLIGSHARYLRHIRFTWPDFKARSFGLDGDEVEARQKYTETLELMRDRCTSLSTLRLHNTLIHQFFDPFLVEELDFLAPRLAAIPSLKNIIVEIEDHSGKRKFREGSIEMLTDRGWIVKYL